MTTFFRHYKNRYYQIVGEALDTRDDTLVIVYRTLYPSEYTELPDDARSRVVHEVEIWK